jgi:hypothetical protein
MPGVKDVSLELIELVSLALTACGSCKAFCSFDFTLEQSNDETLGGFFAIGKLGNPGRWACVDSGGDCSGGACCVAIAWVASALAITPDYRATLAITPKAWTICWCRVT